MANGICGHCKEAPSASNGWCDSCNAAARRAYRVKVKAEGRVLDQRKGKPQRKRVLRERECSKCGIAFMGKDPRCSVCSAAYQAEHYQQNKDRARAKSLKRWYGLTIEQFDAMAAEQEGRCAICGDIPEKVLHVDHDHDSGELRELLCHGCNIGLGAFGDDVDRLMAAAAYLIKHKATEAVKESRNA